MERNEMKREHWQQTVSKHHQRQGACPIKCLPNHGTVRRQTFPDNNGVSWHLLRCIAGAIYF